MKEDWVKIYGTTEQYKLEIMKAILLDNEVDAFELNKRDSSYLNFGEYELYVKLEDVSEARIIVQNNPL